MLERILISTFSSWNKTSTRLHLTKIRQVFMILVFAISLLGMPNVAVKAATTVNLVATADTWMRQGNPTYNYGGATTISQSPNTSARHNSLYLWDLSSISSSATVTSASLTFHVTETSEYDFSLFNMKRTWTEGSNNGTAGSGASWNYYGAGTGNWGSSGAMNTTSDRYNTDLWDATASTFGTSGSVTIPLNAAGIAAVQGWVTTPASNYGLTIQYMGSGTTSDYWIVASSEATTASQRPTLNITYSTDPTIITTGTLNTFVTHPGAASTAQTYTVAGSNLTGNITITAPTGYELSTDGNTYTSSLTLARSGTSVATTTIYVHLYSATLGTYSGDITHASTGAPTVNVAVTGTVSNSVCSTANLPASEDTYLSANDVTYNNGGNTEIHVNATTGYQPAGGIAEMGPE